MSRSESSWLPGVSEEYKQGFKAGREHEVEWQEYLKEMEKSEHPEITFLRVKQGEVE